MSEGETRYDEVSNRINKKLVDLPFLHFPSCIIKIEEYMDTIIDNLCHPKLVSIGPIHHGKHHLQMMELHKLRYLKSLLQQQNESSVDKYVVAVRSLENQARACYAHINCGPDDLVEMLIIDSVFIIKLIRKFKSRQTEPWHDPIFEYDHILSQLVGDLMLVENQIPFFILNQLFNMTRSESDGPHNADLVSLIQDLVQEWYPWPYAASNSVLGSDADHLLGLMYKSWCYSFTKMGRRTLEDRWLTYCASELQKAGIKFDKVVHGKCNTLRHITFDKGTMKIPILTVQDGTESMLRNLILYEHFFINKDQPKYVTNYAFFLHCLIYSSKDVKILRRVGILNNLYSDDDMVHQMLKRLGRNVYVHPIFCYSDVYEKVNAHYGHRRNRWMANLRDNYFDSPWAYISFFGAVLLLLFTFTQTVASIISIAK